MPKIVLPLVPLLAALAASISSASAQNLLVNPGFEAGADRPAGWKLSEGGTGEWSAKAYRGRHGVTLQGNGQDSSVWRSDDLRLTPGGLYCLRFFGRVDPGASGGCVVAGTSRVNRDFRLTENWQEYSYVFSVPQGSETDHVRLGQWQQKGTVYFDEVELWPVKAVPGDGAQTLGAGESVRDGIYRFQADYGGTGANYHRPLLTHRCGFNSDRWTFGPGSELVYRHALSPNLQKSAQVTVSINYYVSGELKLEASREGGTHWTTIGGLGQQKQSGVFELPAALFPGQGMHLRLSAVGSQANFQVNRYAYEAVMGADVPNAEGATHFWETRQSQPEVDFELRHAGQMDNGPDLRLAFSIANRRTSSIDLNCSWQVDTNRPVHQSLGIVSPGRADRSVRVPLDSPGQHRITLQFTDRKGRALYAGQIQFPLGLLRDPRPGYWLAENANAVLWWCESGWKIGRDQVPREPSRKRQPDPIKINLARGEYESAQVVIRSRQNGQLRQAVVSPFTPAKKGAGDSVTARLQEVAYVRVTRPTDHTGEAGWHPDPLPPLHPPLDLRGGQNQPLWLTVHADDKTPSGDYRANVILGLDGHKVSLPLLVHVYDFALPEATHLRSALGIDPHSINRYHSLTNREQQRLVYDKYLRNFAAHRISPYSFFPYDLIRVQFSGNGPDKRAQLDFSQFDQAAARWLDTHKFNSFLLPLQGMGGGTFQSRHLGELEGFKEGTPEHARLFQDYLRQVEQHLRERGWLDQAYTYWFDEPDPKDYAFVVEGMKRIRAAAPGLKRLLTEQPDPALLGQVEIWCGLTPEWTPEKVRARRDAGEEVWWYICCAPKAPYVTEFIDHPGTELRLWPWQSWQYGVQGLLIWTTTYWTSPLVFPEPRVQDPWQDPMSYVSGYDFPVGHVDYWGNGDGRFLYPPRRDYAQDQQPCLDEPVNSIRWESLRDGMEDYEYFWLLQQQIEHLRDSKGKAALLAEARQLLQIPTAISRDLTHFTDDPRLMLEHRARVARMIERLQKLPAKPDQ